MSPYISCDRPNGNHPQKQYQFETGTPGAQGYHWKIPVKPSELHAMSERQACRVAGISRAVYRYSPEQLGDSQIQALLQGLDGRKPR